MMIGFGIARSAHAVAHPAHGCMTIKQMVKIKAVGSEDGEDITTTQ